MQPLVTPAEMQRCDRTAITRFRIPGILLMENAGRAVADHCAAIAAPLEGRRVLVLCGRGNNGGDGFVIARHLLNRGARVDVVLVCRPADMQGDARTNLQALTRLAPDRSVPLTLRTYTSTRSLAPYRHHDLLVDALFGTGFRGAVTSPAREVIAWMNGHAAITVAVDIPSGVDAGTGGVAGNAVAARSTVTMGLAKVGHMTGPGMECAGDVVVADIGIPRTVLNRARPAAFLVETADVRALLPQRPLRVHKYTAGTALIIGGSRQYTGAPILTAQAALRAGAGAVLLGIPAGIREIAAKRVLEVMLVPAPENAEGGFAPSSWDALRTSLDRADAVAAGPGLGLHPDTRAFTVRLVQDVRVPLVLDADALTMLADERSLLRRRTRGTVMTPHTGELSRLTGETPEAIDADRVGAARRTARRFNAVVVLKGPGTVTASPEGRVVVNPTGNPAMATAGSGDVLTGLIASLAAQGLGPFEAAYAGVFIHGLAGDRALARRGGGTLIAGDISAEIPQALAALSGA